MEQKNCDDFSIVEEKIDPETGDYIYTIEGPQYKIDILNKICEEHNTTLSEYFKEFLIKVLEEEEK